MEILILSENEIKLCWTPSRFKQFIWSMSMPFWIIFLEISLLLWTWKKLVLFELVGTRLLLVRITLGSWFESLNDVPTFQNHCALPYLWGEYFSPDPPGCPFRSWSLSENTNYRILHCKHLCRIIHFVHHLLSYSHRWFYLLLKCLA